MPWDNRIHRIGRGGLWSAGSRRFLTRAVIAQREVKVDAPLHDPVVIEPSYGHDLNYACDLWQRIYCTFVGDRRYLRTIQLGASLYSAASPGGGAAPGPDESWSVVSGTDLGSISANVAHYRQVTPTLLNGHTYVDLRTTVFQKPSLFRHPFVVVHELWGNHYRWFRVPHPDPESNKNTVNAIPRVRDPQVRLEGRRQG